MINENVVSIATAYRLDPVLIAAFIETESNGDIYAWRTESHYSYLWDVRKNAPFRRLNASEKNNEVAPLDFHSLAGSRNTEWLGQQASWGPMQVMGAVAREFGFKAHFPELCGDKGIVIGCKLLQRLFRTHSDKERVIAAYNAGTPKLIAPGRFANQEYVDKVLSAMRRVGSV